MDVLNFSAIFLYPQPCVRTVDVGRWKSKDETGAQQEMDGVDDRFDGTSQNGLGLVEQKMQRSRDKVWAGGA